MNFAGTSRGLVASVTLGVALLGGGLSCSETSVTGVEVARLELTPSEMTLSPGQSREIGVEVLDGEGRVLPDRAVSWSTDDPEVATVSRGLVTAQGTGATIVRASSEGATATADVTVGVGPSIELGTDMVNLAATAGSSDPQLESVGISNSGGGTLDALRTSIAWGSGVSGWLDASLNRTTAPATLGLSATAADLVAGTYTADVEVASPAASNSPRTVHVIFEVQEGPPTIRVSDSQVDFAVTEGGASPPPDTVDVTNQGGGELTGLDVSPPRYITDPTGWLTADLGGAVAPTTLALAVDASGFTDGVYEAEVDVTSADAANSPVTVDVTLIVGDPPASIRLSEDSLKFVAFHNGIVPSGQDVVITNQGGFQLENIRVSAVSYGSPFTGWLDVSTPEGIAPDTVTLQPNTSNQTPGTYVATVDIAATADNSPQSVEVVYQIRPRADLQIEKTDTPDPVEAGGRITYTITVTNAGPSAATNVVVQETPASNLTYVSDSPSKGSYDESADEWSVGTMASGETETLTLQFDVAPTAQAPIENTAGVSSPVDDPVANNDEATAVTDVAPPAAPSDLAASAASPTRIDLSWSDNSTNETGFEVQQSTDDGESWTTVVTVGADQEVATIQPLTDGTTHTYRVRAVNDFTESDWSSPASATTPLAAPSGLSATVISSSEIDLSWTDNSEAEDGFEVQRRNVSAGGSFSTVTTVGANSTTYSDSGLEPATQYEYRVRARNAAAGTSAWSDPAGATTEDVVPDAPSSLSANAASAERIDLQWTDNSDNEDGFEVERSTDGGSNWTQIATPGANKTSYQDKDVGDGTTYSYQVRAVNSAGESSYSNEASATTPLPAPTNPGASVLSASEIRVTWTDNSTNEVRFRIQRSPDGGSTWTDAGTVGADATTFDDSGLQSATTYSYRVRAESDDTISNYTNSVSATTDELPPDAPSNLNATPVSSSAIDLTWDDNSGNEDDFELQRDDGSGFATIATVGPDTESYSDTGLQEGAAYTYRVRARNTGGESAWSNEASATTILLAPTDLVATVFSSSQINLEWTDNSSAEDNYEIQRRNVTAGESFSTVATVGRNATSYSDTGLQDGTTYEYRVRAVNSVTESSYSNTASETTGESIAAAPSNLSADAVSSTRIDVAWTDESDNEDDFELQSRTDGTDFGTIATLAANTETYSNTGLQEATTYTYRVRARNSGGDSDWSNEASETTPESAPAAPSNLVASALSSTEIDLSWDDNADNEDEFELQGREEDDDDFSTIATLPANTLNYLHTDLEEETTYQYRVRASNSGGDSDWSSQASATTLEELSFSDGWFGPGVRVS